MRTLFAAKWAFTLVTGSMARLNVEGAIMLTVARVRVANKKDFILTLTGLGLYWILATAIKPLVALILLRLQGRG
ncbi:hypothetical protein A9Q90_06700 [Gammaproteobacteria bacterium 54_18_T64]|nr:hypothetical protein A9Q90_06700 [Gammaproteobacteria bacterium 54_18_T64]